MTVSELTNHIHEKGWRYFRADGVESLIGTTIIADPEPRPDFASMAPSDLLSWIYQNGKHDETRRIFYWLTTVANDIADRQGLT